MQAKYIQRNRSPMLTPMIVTNQCDDDDDDDDMQLSHVCMHSNN